MPLTKLYCTNCKLEPVDIEQYKGGCDCVPPAIVELIRKNLKGSYHHGTNVSASVLTGCLRKTYLERTNDYANSLEAEYWMIRGSLIHQVFEGYSPDWECEQTYFKTLPNGQKVYGTVDAYHPETQTLVDYKSCADEAFMFFKGKPKPDHVFQTNVYRWLLHGGTDERGSTVIKPVDNIVIWYIAMKRCVRTGGKYSVREGFGAKKQLVEYQMEPVPIIDVEPWIIERSKIMEKAFGKGKMPPMLVKEELWRCKICPVKALCDAYEQRAYNERTEK